MQRLSFLAPVRSIRFSIRLTETFLVPPSPQARDIFVSNLLPVARFQDEILPISLPIYYMAFGGLISK
jgi:hypothetical protein